MTLLLSVGMVPAHSVCVTDTCWRMKEGKKEGWAEVRMSFPGRMNNIHKSMEA